MATPLAPEPPTAGQAIAYASKYGPSSAYAIQRSQYLADALRNLQTTAPQDIRTPGALFSNLAASALLNYGRKNADKQAMDAFGRDRSAMAASLTSGLGAMPAAGPASPTVPSAPPPDAAPSPPAPMPAPGGGDMASLARGLRNNNPTNLTQLSGGQTWNGQTGADGDYAKFATPQDGWNAADKNLTSYYLKHGLNTVDGVINRWAPGSPPGYAQTVASALKTGPDAPLDLGNPDIRHAMLGSMGGFENGQPIQFGQGVGPQAAPAPIPQPAQVPPAQAPGPPMASGAAPAVSPPAGVAPSPAGQIPHGMVTPDEVALTKRLLSDPRTYDQGIAMALQLQERQAKALAPPDKMMWGPDGKVHPMPGTETHQLQGQTPSDAAQQDAFGNITHTAIPGMQGTPPAGTVFDGTGYRALPQPQYGGGPQAGAAPGHAHSLADLVQTDPVTGERKTDPRLAPLMQMREGFRTSKQNTEYTEALSSYSGLSNAVAQATKNNGILDTAAIDSLWRTINPGATVRQGNMKMMLEHLGVPQQLEGLILNVTGNGFVTPETLQQAMGLMHSYVQARQADVQTLTAADGRIAKQFGVDDLGEDVAPIPEAPKVQFVHSAPAPAPNPGDAAKRAQILQLHQAGQLTPAQEERARKLGIIK